MIKLIASDLDGTLLQNNSQSISKRMLEIIEQLHEKGILFVAASGRQYPNLYRLFEPASKYMAFICENGGLVKYQDKVISKIPMERELGIQLMKDIWNTEGCEVLLSGENTSYLKPKAESYLHRMRDVVKNNVTVVEDLYQVKEDFIKISVYEESGIVAGHGSYFTNKWQDKFKCTISGHGWLDFTAPNVNKGTALASLTSKLSIDISETMAFGDNYNDLEMLSLVGHGYVMENAVEDIKRRYQLRSTLVEDTLTALLKDGTL
jgi:Cof subfamily protein (haloacid dehalogenase superfamily)